MIETFKQLMGSQFQASLTTLSHCVLECPATIWCQRIARYPFCQVAFHSLFFTDYYLGLDAESLRQQPFHVSNPELFGDYEPSARVPRVSRLMALAIRLDEQLRRGELRDYAQIARLGQVSHCIGHCLPLSHLSCHRARARRSDLSIAESHCPGRADAAIDVEVFRHVTFNH